MAESDLRREILLGVSNGDARLFRVNAGVAWQGQIIEQTRERLVLLHPRAIRLGVEGLSDLIGWSAGAIFTAIELKTGRLKATPAQQAFIDTVLRAGGRAGVARSLDDAVRIMLRRTGQ